MTRRVPTRRFQFQGSRIDRFRARESGCGRLPLRASERYAGVLLVAAEIRERSTAIRHSPATTGRESSSPAPADAAGVSRGVFALVGGFKFHSVSLRGRLYPLPRCPTFRFRNLLHLAEARDRVAHVRGVLQRFLALLGKSELACRYPITR